MIGMKEDDCICKGNQMQGSCRWSRCVMNVGSLAGLAELAGGSQEAHPDWREVDAGARRRRQSPDRSGEHDFHNPTGFHTQHRLISELHRSSSCLLQAKACMKASVQPQQALILEDQQAQQQTYSAQNSGHHHRIHVSPTCCNTHTCPLELQCHLAELPFASPP